LPGAQLTSLVSERALHGAKADADASLVQDGVNDSGVSVGLFVKDLHCECRRLLVESSRRRPLLNERRITAAQIAPHGVSRDAELLRDALGAPAHRRERSELLHLLHIDHRALVGRSIALFFDHVLPRLRMTPEGVSFGGVRGSILVAPYRRCAKRATTLSV
jgi:hypothetical protein